MTEILGTCYSHPLDPPDVIKNAAVYPIGGCEVGIRQCVSRFNFSHDSRLRFPLIFCTNFHMTLYVH